MLEVERIFYLVWMRMKNNMIIKEFIQYIKGSNRYKHFLYVIPICLFAIIIPNEFMITYIAVVAASCLEFKNKLHGCYWDWVDYWFTVLGGILINIIYVAVA